MLEGTLELRHKKPGMKYGLHSGEHYIQYVHPSELLFIIKQPFKLLIISLKETYLKWLDPTELQLNKNLGITLAMKPVISAIIFCQEIWGVKRISFESKILELIFLTLDQTRQERPARTLKATM